MSGHKWCIGKRNRLNSWDNQMSKGHRCCFAKKSLSYTWYRLKRSYIAHKVIFNCMENKSLKLKSGCLLCIACRQMYSNMLDNQEDYLHTAHKPHQILLFRLDKLYITNWLLDRRLNYILCKHQPTCIVHSLLEKNTLHIKFQLS